MPHVDDVLTKYCRYLLIKGRPQRTDWGEQQLTTAHEVNVSRLAHTTITTRTMLHTTCIPYLVVKYSKVYCFVKSRDSSQPSSPLLPRYVNQWFHIRTRKLIVISLYSTDITDRIRKREKLESATQNMWVALRYRPFTRYSCDVISKQQNSYK